MNMRMIVAGLCGGCLTVGMSAHADTPLTNETNAVVAAVQTNGTNAVAEAVDEAIVLTPKERVERRLQEFAKKKGDGFAYGVLNKKVDEIYYAAISPVFSLGTNDTIATVSQRAFNRAFTGILLRRAMATFAYSASFDSSDGGVAGGIITEIGDDEIWSGILQTAEFPMPGMSVVQIYQAVSADGELVVGVIVKADSPRDEVARCAAKGVRPSVPHKKGIPYKKLLEIPDDRLALMFGTVFYYNENGEPELMSFGHQGISATSDSKARTKAFAHAETEAQDSLSTFLTGVVQAKITRKLAAFGTDLMIDNLSISWVISSRANLRGGETVMRKILKPSTGEEIAFVAIRLPVWSFPEEKPEQKAEPTKTAEADKKYDF